MKKDLIGLVVGRWSVIDSVDRGDGRGYWLCECSDCGHFKEYRTDRLTGNIHLRDCDGCTIKRRDDNGKIRPEYESWSGMKARCNDPNHIAYKYYGGRGVTFSEEWRSFDTFYKDMGERPIKHSLDRIDPNGNYCKENCRWADAKTQAKNRRPINGSKINEFDRETIKTLVLMGVRDKEISERYGISLSYASAIRHRLKE